MVANIIIFLPRINSSISTGHPDIVRYLASMKADVNHKDSFKNTPLLVAIKPGYIPELDFFPFLFSLLSVSS